MPGTSFIFFIFCVIIPGDEEWSVISSFLYFSLRRSRRRPLLGIGYNFWIGFCGMYWIFVHNFMHNDVDAIRRPFRSAITALWSGGAELWAGVGNNGRGDSAARFMIVGDRLCSHDVKTPICYNIVQAIEKIIQFYHRPSLWRYGAAWNIFSNGRIYSSCA